MNARFLLDTNAMREPLRPAPNPAFLSKFRTHRACLAIAAPALHDALFGLQRMPAGRKRDEVRDFLENVLLPTVELLPYDAEAARWHASERARLERAGTPVPFADGTIAAVGARFGLTIVTHNVRDFQRFLGIMIEDWMDG